MGVYVCIHAPRKEWRNRLPIKVNIVHAESRKEALAKFIPLHSNEPTVRHYNKPYAIDECQSPHYIG